MTWSLTVEPEAEADLERARVWYEDRRPSLGDEFLDQVEKTFRSIQRMPHLFGEVYRQARIVSIDRFPYAILYRFKGEQITVLAVFHTRSDPQAWQERV